MSCDSNLLSASRAKSAKDDTSISGTTRNMAHLIKSTEPLISSRCNENEEESLAIGNKNLKVSQWMSVPSPRKICSLSKLKKEIDESDIMKNKIFLQSSSESVHYKTTKDEKHKTAEVAQKSYVMQRQTCKDVILSGTAVKENRRKPVTEDVYNIKKSIYRKLGINDRDEVCSEHSNRFQLNSSCMEVSKTTDKISNFGNELHVIEISDDEMFSWENKTKLNFVPSLMDNDITSKPRQSVGFLKTPLKSDGFRTGNRKFNHSDLNTEQNKSNQTSSSYSNQCDGSKTINKIINSNKSSEELEKDIQLLNSQIITHTTALEISSELQVSSKRTDEKSIQVRHLARSDATEEKISFCKQINKNEILNNDLNQLDVCTEIPNSNVINIIEISDDDYSLNENRTSNNTDEKNDLIKLENDQSTFGQNLLSSKNQQFGKLSMCKKMDSNEIGNDEPSISDYSLDEDHNIWDNEKTKDKSSKNLTVEIITSECSVKKNQMTILNESPKLQENDHMQEAVVSQESQSNQFAFSTLKTVAHKIDVLDHSAISVTKKVVKKEDSSPTLESQSIFGSCKSEEELVLESQMDTSSNEIIVGGYLGNTKICNESLELSRFAEESPNNINDLKTRHVNTEAKIINEAVSDRNDQSNTLEVNSELNKLSDDANKVYTLDKDVLTVSDNNEKHLLNKQVNKRKVFVLIEHAAKDAVKKFLQMKKTNDKSKFTGNITKNEFQSKKRSKDFPSENNSTHSSKRFKHSSNDENNSYTTTLPKDLNLSSNCINSSMERQITNSPTNESESSKKNLKLAESAIKNKNDNNHNNLAPFNITPTERTIENDSSKKPKKIHIIQHIIINPDKQSKTIFENDNNTFGEIRSQTLNRNPVKKLRSGKTIDQIIKDVKSNKKFIALIESICAQMNIKCHDDYKPQAKKLTQLADKKLFLNSTKRYSKLKTFNELNDSYKSTSLGNKFNGTSGFIRDDKASEDADRFTDFEQVLNNNYEELYKIFMNKFGKNYTETELIGFIDEILSRHNDTYKLLQETGLNLQIKDTSKGNLQILTYLSNLLTEYFKRK